MDESKDPDYESARLDYVGFVDPYALEGLLILKSDDGREFLMRAFSGEVAKNKYMQCLRMCASKTVMCL